jgi:hypothetical protein
LKREDVRQCFDGVAARSRDDIAAAISKSVPALGHHLPKRRRHWEGEDRRLSVFTAAALALAYYHNGAAALLDDLRNAA